MCIVCEGEWWSLRLLALQSDKATCSSLIQPVTNSPMIQKNGTGTQLTITNWIGLTILQRGCGHLLHTGLFQVIFKQKQEFLSNHLLLSQVVFLAFCSLHNTPAAEVMMMHWTLVGCDNCDNRRAINNACRLWSSTLFTQVSIKKMKFEEFSKQKEVERYTQ